MSNRIERDNVLVTCLYIIFEIVCKFGNIIMSLYSQKNRDCDIGICLQYPLCPLKLLPKISRSQALKLHGLRIVQHYVHTRISIGYT